MWMCVFVKMYLSNDYFHYEVLLFYMVIVSVTVNIIIGVIIGVFVNHCAKSNQWEYYITIYQVCVLL